MHYNTKLGLILFFVYLLVYSGFVLLCAFSPSTMEKVILAGVNLAILFGFGLILFAFLLSLVYGFLCRTDEEDIRQSSQTNGEAK